jgi:RNA polymerase sigma-70 factor, ECF subfamily
VTPRRPTIATPPPPPPEAIGAIPTPVVTPPPIPAEAVGMIAAESPPPIPEAALTEFRAREAEHLVDAARRGDARAFDALVKRYRHRIFALALHMTGSPSDADDITQDAFVRAFNNIHKFEGRSEFFTWLYRIALNRALNVRRDRNRRRTADLDDPRVTVAVAVDSGGDPARALELRQGYAMLVRAFDKLSPLLKTTIALTMMQGLSYPEAAVVLETTEGTIAWRIHEARKQMRVALDAALKDPTPVRLVLEKAEKARVKDGRREPLAQDPVHSALEMALALLAPSV